MFFVSSNVNSKSAVTTTGFTTEDELMVICLNSSNGVKTIA